MYVSHIYIYIYTYIYIYIYREREIILFLEADLEDAAHVLARQPEAEPRGFQGYRLKDTAKGPQFEEAKTHILLNQKCIAESQNDSSKGENPALETPESHWQRIGFI